MSARREEERALTTEGTPPPEGEGRENMSHWRGHRDGRLVLIARRNGEELMKDQ